MTKETPMKNALIVCAALLLGLMASPAQAADAAASAKAQAALGDSLLKAGKSEAGFQALNLAKAADPSNAQMIADLPVAAYRTGRLGLAAAAAQVALDAQMAAPLQGEAWFNMGLICDAAIARAPDLEFGGKSYCTGDTIADFLRAWEFRANTARSAKLVSVMQTGSTRPHDPPPCRVGGIIYRFGFAADPFTGGPAETVYALHTPDREIDPSVIRWAGSSVTPGVPSGYDLDGPVLSVMRVARQVGSPTIAGQKCPG
jgi:hypothetical protein